MVTNLLHYDATKVREGFMKMSEQVVVTARMVKVGPEMDAQEQLDQVVVVIVVVA